MIILLIGSPRGLASIEGWGCGRQVQKNKVESFSETKRLLEPPPAVGREPQGNEVGFEFVPGLSAAGFSSV